MNMKTVIATYISMNIVNATCRVRWINYRKVLMDNLSQCLPDNLRRVQSIQNELHEFNGDCDIVLLLIFPY